MAARIAALAERPPASSAPALDWRAVACLVLRSRALDEIEESRLLPERKVLYQFSARGHELAQILLGLQLTDPHDAATVYYRSRPLMLALGTDLEDAAAGPLARAGAFSDGRDIGVVFNRPGQGRASVLPACGGVGAQYTPAAGWAQAIRYRHEALGEADYARSIAVVLGGDASTATNGFWAALNIATTQKLPMLFYIEDNAFGISVPSTLQTPGGNIASNLSGFAGLAILEGDGSDPKEAAALTAEAVARVREERAPLLLRLTVPRLSGHSGQDTQAYKSSATLSAERARDPLTRLHGYLVPRLFAEAQWGEAVRAARADVEAAVERALRRPPPEAASLTRHVFSEEGSLQLQG
ncbi:MAG TPA: thiamine pyrophosphate-dependent enzyme, partial [Steroidobacteraceae bacterium]|nr:thiamine pyrophosphate-dependent enzyme [Steroidobacteraceae bacterium]